MAKEDIFMAIGQLAFSIAKADGEVQAEEKEALKNIMRANFNHEEAEQALSWVEWLDKKNQDTIEEAYQYSMLYFRQNKQYLTQDLKQKFVNIIEQVADSSDGISSDEQAIIDKFKTDIFKI